MHACTEGAQVLAIISCVCFTSQFPHTILLFGICLCFEVLELFVLVCREGGKAEAYLTISLSGDNHVDHMLVH